LRGACAFRARNCSSAWAERRQARKRPRENRKTGRSGAERRLRRAIAEILALDLPIAGLLNNAGIMPSKAGRNSIGWDLTFTTNYLGPFALTEGLIPHLPDGTDIAFVVSAIEDPERKPAKLMGMRGGRFRSIEASVRGEWLPGGAKMPGIDAYATSKQCSLAAALALARENPQLRINAVEPGINPSTGLGDMNAVLRFVGRIMMRLPPFGRYRSTPEQAARVLTAVLTDRSRGTGIYYDEKGVPMTGSVLAADPIFQDHVVAQTRAFLARNIG
jgi:NAD(P)-dependent dehydrogenase (short-subunit alcohol dehydrogenase family)